VVLADTTTSSSGGLLFYIPLIGVALLLYFGFIRPQGRRRKEAQQMQANIGPGDEVQTIGGLYGTVTEVDDESTTIEASPGVHLRFAKQAIGKVISKAAQAPEDDADDAGNSDAKNVIDRG
jgi:preprotein translocase subunit YajC